MANSRWQNDLANATLSQFSPEVTSQILKNIGFIGKMKQMSQVKYNYAGKDCELKLISGEITTAQGATRKRETDPREPSIFDTIVVPWTEITASTVWPNSDIEKNAKDPEQLIDMAQEYAQAAEYAVQKFLLEEMFSDGVNVSRALPGHQPLLGFGKVFGTGDTGTITTNAGDYLNVDRSANAFWRVVLENNGGNGNAAKALSIQDIRQFQRKCAGNDEEVDGPDIALCSENMYAWIENIHTQGNSTYNSKDTNLSRDNGIPIGKCVYYPCTVAGFTNNIGKVNTLTAAHLNMKYWKLWFAHGEKKGMKTRSFDGLPDADVTVTNWMLSVAMGCRRLNKQGLFTNRALA